MSPRAIMIPSAASMISSKFSIPCWFSIFANNWTWPLPVSSQIARTSFTSFAVRTNEIAMKLIPCLRPKRISSLSRSARAGKGIFVLGMFTPFCLAMIPSFSTSTTNSRFAASFSTTRRPNLPSSTNTWCPTSTSSKMSSAPATFKAITSRVDLIPCFVATRIRSPVLYEYSLASPSNNSVRISGPFVSRR